MIGKSKTGFSLSSAAALLYRFLVRTRAAVIVVLLCAIVTVASWFFLRESKPGYKGRSLEYWMDSYATAENHAEAEQAIRCIGTNAFPILLEWIRQPEPKRPVLLYRVAEILPRPVRPKWADAHYVQRSYLSAYTFQALGTQACTVIPELLVIAAGTTNREVATTAYQALAYMGSNGVPALLAVLDDRSHLHRARAAFVLGHSEDLGPYTNAVIVELIARLDDPSVDQWAASALGKLKTQPELVVPALAGCLERTNSSSKLRIIAATALIWFDQKAVPALPHLTNALNDPDPIVRRNVAESIKRIHYRAQTK